ncbi:cupin domain-containing protein [Enterococcus ratti]|uniref:Ethanolamine utilization protein EutQ n=1 Tax=Enterococcus ratti TaxID=150033 RepID=A0A1L8WPV3_9ENTE|nr:cupin domain-containing protein [Enterococcus ratti]OJG82862.1 ethanolamine utilization protein EutQ [Enterococcus ratti]
MTTWDRQMIEHFVRQLIMEKFMPAKQVDPSGISSVKLAEISLTEEDRLDTGNSTDQVYTKDLFSLQESPHLGCGLMEMTATTFDWTLDYDEIDYVISGQLDVLIDGRKISAKAGEMIFIPKSSSIQFSVQENTRFLYITYPADWQAQTK